MQTSGLVCHPKKPCCVLGPWLSYRDAHQSTRMSPSCLGFVMFFIHRPQPLSYFLKCQWTVVFLILYMLIVCILMLLWDCFGGRKTCSKYNRFKAPLYWMGKALDNSVILSLAKLHVFTFCILIFSLPAFWSRPTIFELVQLASNNLYLFISIIYLIFKSLRKLRY